MLDSFSTFSINITHILTTETMKKLIFILAISLISCKKDSIEPVSSSQKTLSTQSIDHTGLLIGTYHGYDLNPSFVANTYYPAIPVSKIDNNTVLLGSASYVWAGVTMTFLKEDSLRAYYTVAPQFNGWSRKITPIDTCMFLKPGYMGGPAQLKVNFITKDTSTTEAPISHALGLTKN